MYLKYFLLLFTTKTVFAKEEVPVKEAPLPVLTAEPTEEEGTAAEIQEPSHKRRRGKQKHETNNQYLDSDKTLTNGSGDQCVLDSGVLALEKLFLSKAAAMKILIRYNVGTEKYHMTLEMLRSLRTPITDLTFATQLLVGTKATDKERIELSTHLRDIRESELNPCFMSAIKATMEVTPEVKASIRDKAKFKALFDNIQKKIGSSNDKVFLLKQRLYIEQYRNYVFSKLNTASEGLDEKKKNRLLSYAEELNSLLFVIDKKVFGEEFNSQDVQNYDLNFNPRETIHLEPEETPPVKNPLPLTT